MTQVDKVAEISGRNLRITAIAGGSMSIPEGAYLVGQRETLAEVRGLRVRLLTLLKGQIVPWHYHSTITDTFFCMRGPMRILTRAPVEAHTLYDGDTLAISPGTPHLVESTSAAGCQFMIVQGVGKYDYVPVND